MFKVCKITWNSKCNYGLRDVLGRWLLFWLLFKALSITHSNILELVSLRMKCSLMKQINVITIRHVKVKQELSHMADTLAKDSLQIDSVVWRGPLVDLTHLFVPHCFLCYFFIRVFYAI